MRLINSSIEIVHQIPDIIGGYKHIEKAARNCYKSEDKISDDSYNRILNILQTNKHYSPLEHFTVYLKAKKSSGIIDFYKENPFSRVNKHKYNYYITTNFRVIVENNRQDDLKYFVQPTKHHAKRITVKVECSEAIAREANRHRTFSISQQSTRYCNYASDKFNNEITFVIPQ